MRRNMFLSLATAILLAGTTLSCDDPADPNANEVAQVEIIGNDRAVIVGQSLQFHGRAVTNSVVRVDDLVTWSVSPAGLVTINAELVTIAGSLVNRVTVTGVAQGGVTLTASAGTKSKSILINVSDPGPA